MRIMFTAFVLLCGVITLTEQGGIIGAKEALYLERDHVVILNATTIRSTIYETNNAWLVEFFSSWCGHCIHFAPVYKKFAAEVEAWHTVVKIAVIDCADEANIAICREYEIMGYPTLLFFPPRSPTTTKTDDGMLELNRGRKFERSDKVSQLKHNLIEVLTFDFRNILGDAPDMTSVEDIWKYIDNSTISTDFTPLLPTLAIVLFESEKSFIGKELSLRLSSAPDIRVLRFFKKNNLFKTLGIKNGWPAAGYIKRNLQSGIIPIPKNKDITAFLQSSALQMIQFQKQFPPQQISTAAQTAIEGTHPDNQENNIGEPVARVYEDVISLEDLIHAVRNSLRNEVGIFKTIEGSKLIALKQYVYTLGQLFPADRREFKVFLLKLNEWLETKIIIGGFQINEYLDKMTELEVEFHPWDIDATTWGNCRGTLPGRRGYTCSLWRLFHSLTIISSQRQQEISVLSVIYGYVKEFFGCTECVLHFAEMVENEGALSITSVTQQALWLWRAHNKVNIRLKGSPSEDPSFPKRLYPSAEQCSSCQNSGNLYNEYKVLEYLNNVYSHPARTLQIKQVQNKNLNLHENILPQALSEPREQHVPSRFFSGTDYWIFCIVYISVAVLLIVGYIHFKFGTRRRLNPFSVCTKILYTSKCVF